MAMALLVAACGDEAEDTTTTAPEATTTTEAGSTTEAESTTTTAPTSTTVPFTIEPGLEGLTVIDELTFTVEFAEADPEFPLKLAYAAFFPLPEVAFDDPVAFEENVIGNGPFMMDGPWEHDVVVPMRAFEGYVGPDPAQVEQLQFIIIDDLNTAYNEVLAGGLDILGPTLPTDQIELAAEEFGERYGLSSSTSYTYIGFPLYLPEFADPDVRRALSMAIDRDLIIEQIYANTRVAAFSTIPPIFQGAREHVCDYWDYNPDEARALWDSIDHPDSLVVWFNTGGSHEDWVEAVANMWRNTLGIEEITFESLEFSEYNPLLDAQGATGPFRLGWGQDYPSPLNFLEPLYASYNTPPVGSNNVFFDSPEFDDLIAQGKAAVAASGGAGRRRPVLPAGRRHPLRPGGHRPGVVPHQPVRLRRGHRQRLLRLVRRPRGHQGHQRRRVRFRPAVRAGAPVPHQLQRVERDPGAAGTVHRARPVRRSDQRDVPGQR